MARKPTTAPKPRLRVAAGSDKRWAPNGSYTADSFQNFAASLGVGASNLSSGSTYGFNPITRNHTLLEWAYRGSWLVKVIVDAVADDMTREGVNIESDMPPDRMDLLNQHMDDMLIWQRVNEAIKWARLYGGALAVLMIDGQKTDTPLRLDTVGKDQFKGLLVLDRWMVWPHLDDPVNDLGKDYGLPRFYEVVSDARVIPHMKIHYSRCIRLDGVELPYWQKMAENFWGLSVIEPLYDRLVAFDSTTQGAAQLVYRAHLRTLSIEKLRELIAFGGDAYQAVVQQVQQIRLYQANEGLTLIDAADKFETYQYAFGGLSDVMVQFAQQLSGAAQIPLVRLFGQSPAGLNATGDSDIRNYYDFINATQEARLRRPLQLLYDLAHRSCFGEKLPAGFNFEFAPLWQLADTEKAQVASSVTQAVVAAQQAGIASAPAALKELRQSSRVTGIWSNITDEEIKQAEDAPPPMQEGGEQQAGQEQAAAGQPAKPAAMFGGEQPAQRSGSVKPGEDEDAAPRLPPHPSGLNDIADLHERYGHLRPMATPQDVAQHYAHMVGDANNLPMIEVQGIPITIETYKDARRQGNGWATQMPADYGFFNATRSHDGEQLDCFVGDDPESNAVWVIEQNDPDTGAFDELKVMIGFSNRTAALDTYKAAFDDNAERRIGGVRRMSIAELKRVIEEMSSSVPRRVNGG